MFALTVTADTLDDLKTKISGALAQFAEETGDAPAEEKKPRKPSAKAAEKKPEPEPEKAAEPEPEKAAEPELSMMDVRSKLAELINLGEQGSKASIEIVAKLGALDEKGLPKAAAIKPEQFAECIRLVDAKLDELTPKGVL